MQELCCIHFDAQDLTLQFPSEANARQLTCQLLQPNEQDLIEALDAAEVQRLFGPDANGDGDLPPSDAENYEPPEDDANIEAENLVQPDAQGDDANEEAGEISEADAMDDAAPGEPDDDLHRDPMEVPYNYHELNAEDFDVVEELVYEAPSKSPAPAEAPFVVSSTSSSSRGLNVTPMHVRSLLPPSSSAKIQLRISKRESVASGWQAWSAPLSPSKWFSFGPSGQYVDQEKALNAAIAWLWDQQTS